MKYAALGCLMLLGSAGASAQSVEVGTGDWTDLPWVYQEGHFRMTAAMVDRVHEIARQGTCTVPGMSARRLDLTVPVIIQFGAGNSVERLVVEEYGLPAARIRSSAAWRSSSPSAATIGRRARTRPAGTGPRSASCRAEARFGLKTRKTRSARAKADAVDAFTGESRQLWQLSTSSGRPRARRARRNRNPPHRRRSTPRGDRAWPRSPSVP